MLAGVSHEFFFARSASRQKLVACLTCKDIEIVETTSMTGSSLSTVTQNAMRAKQANKQENNWVQKHENIHKHTHIFCNITVIFMERQSIQFISHVDQTWLWWGPKKREQLWIDYNILNINNIWWNIYKMIQYLPMIQGRKQWLSPFFKYCSFEF